MNTTSVTNGSEVATSTLTYSDPNDPFMPSSIEDSNGHTWTYTYDQYGNMLTGTQPSPRSTVTTNTYSYSSFALGELTSSQTGSKQATTLTYYEPSGNVDQINTPTPGTVGGSSTVTSSFVYDTLGNVTSVTAPGNAASSTITTTFNYTTDGSYTQTEAWREPVTITDNMGKVTHLRYDSQGNVTTTVDALGNETDIARDITNHPVTITLPATGESGPNRGYVSSAYQYPDGPLASLSIYDESGNEVRTTHYSYDLCSDLIAKSGSTEPVTYGYDALYRIKTLTDGGGHTTSYTYNPNGFVSSVSYPNANTSTGYDVESFPSYDAQGDLLERIDGRGIETDYAYSDPDNLLTSVSYPSSPSLNVTYSYDAYGRASGTTDGAAAAASGLGAGVVSYYDDDDNVISVYTTYKGATSGTYVPQQAITYTYNGDGSRASMVTPAGTFSYGFDGDGRAVSQTNPFGETTNWSYLDNGWMHTRALSNGVTTTNAFDALGRILNSSTANSSSAILSDFSIPSTGGYDGAGNILARTDSITAASAYSGSTGYTYDTKDQLTQEASTRGSGYTNNFAYDASTITGPGNPTSFKGVTNTFNSDNQYTNTGYTYDGEGNPTTYKGASLTFDPEDRLTGYGTALTNGYLACGLRAWKQNSSGTRTYFLYSGSFPVCELDSSGDVTATNTFGADGLISRRVGSTSTFYTFDLQGGNAQRLSSSGSVIGSSMFDAYGSSVSSDGTTDPFSGYGAKWGYYSDSETGLELCTHRFYDPANGRFINRDPIRYNGGINLYNYTSNSPVRFCDPMGCKALCPDQILWIIAAVVVVVAVAVLAPEVLPFLADGAEDLAADEAADALGDGVSDIGEDGACDDPPGCFVAGTLVHMADGTVKAIEKVKPGEKVESRDPATGKTEIKTVLVKMIHPVNDLVTLHFADEKTKKEVDHVTSSLQHPFYVVGEGFTPAGELRVGECIETRTGAPVLIDRIDHTHSVSPVLVYNFTIQDDHTYFVGSANGGEWVHNITCPKNLGDLMNDSPYNTTQPNVSGDLIDNYSDQLMDGSEASPIKVDGDTITDGNHRAIADALARANGYDGPPLGTVPGVTSNAGPVIPWEDVNVY